MWECAAVRFSRVLEERTSEIWTGSAPLTAGAGWEVGGAGVANWPFEAIVVVVIALVSFRMGCRMS